MMTKRIFPWVLAVSKRLLRQMSTMTKPRFLSEYDRAAVRATLAFGGTAPAVVWNEELRGVVGADAVSLAGPPCGSGGAGRGHGGRACQEVRCDECRYTPPERT